MELLISIIGILLVLVAFPYAIKVFNSHTSNQKLKDLETKFSFHFYKISNKRCSIKRLRNIDWVDKNLMLQRCNILVENDFIIIQGISMVGFFNSVVKNMMIAQDPEVFKNTFPDWEIIKPLAVELNTNKTEIKIVFKPNRSLSNANYSLIISDLEQEAFAKIEKIKNYC